MKKIIKIDLILYTYFYILNFIIMSRHPIYNESSDNESSDNESSDNESSDNESSDNESSDNIKLIKNLNKYNINNIYNDNFKSILINKRKKLINMLENNTINNTLFEFLYFKFQVEFYIGTLQCLNKKLLFEKTICIENILNFQNDYCKNSKRIINNENKIYINSFNFLSDEYIDSLPQNNIQIF